METTPYRSLFLKLLLELARKLPKLRKKWCRKKKSTRASIDDIVKIVRFEEWQTTTAGKQEVKKALRSVVWMKYKIKDKEVFDKAYNYIEQYY